MEFIASTDGQQTHGPAVLISYWLLDYLGGGLSLTDWTATRQEGDGNSDTISLTDCIRLCRFPCHYKISRSGWMTGEVLC